MINSSEAAQELLRRRAARNNLFDYIKYIKPWWIDGEHHKQMCKQLERLEKGEIRRLLIKAPPRHSKSEICSKTFPAWCLGKHPDWQVISVTWSDDLSNLFSSEIRDTIPSAKYQALFPGVALNPDTKAKRLWRTSAGGVYLSTTPGGGASGFGGDLVIIDDPYKGRVDIEYPRTRELVLNFFIGDLMQRLMPGGRVLIMQTTWHQDDLASTIPKKENYEVLTLPAISKDKDGNDRALWPEYWPLEDTKDEQGEIREGLYSIKKRNYEHNRKRDWECQYQQNPIPDDGTFILRKWFESKYEPHELPLHLNIYVSSDFAVTEPREGANPDYTVHGVFGQDKDGILYVLDWWRGRETADVWIEELLNLIDKWKPLCWFGEKGQIANSIQPFLIRRKRERQVYFQEHLVPSKKSKTERARSFQAAAASGIIRFPANTQWADEVIEQCVGFPGVSHDDDFDVMSLICVVLDKQYKAVVNIPRETEKPDYAAKWGSFNKKGSNWKTI